MSEKDDIVVVEEKELEENVSGELDSSKEDEKEKKQQKVPAKKRGNDNQKRMNELWLKAKEKEELANHNANLANSEKAKNTEYERITASALEENINTKRELLTERLIRAQESGDNKKSAEITAELSKVEAQAAQIERYKIENQVRGNGQQPVNKQPQQRQQTEEPVADADEMYERMSPSGKRWLDENRDWYETSGENHDPEKAGDVTYYAQTLESEYRNSGRTAEIGTRAYFKKIDDYIKNNWSDEVQESKDDEEEEAAPAKKNYAAPVGNRSAANPAPGARKEYKISQQEKEFALALNTKGKNGKPLSDDEKLKRFISLRESTPSSGPISMKTVKGA